MIDFNGYGIGEFLGSINWRNPFKKKKKVDLTKQLDDALESSKEKRIFKIDVRNIPPDQVDEYTKEVMKKFKK